MNLEQAQFEIEALQRRLAEYAGELERVKAKCAAMRSALDRAQWDFAALIARGDLADEPRAHKTLEIVQAALATDAGKGYVPFDKARVIAEALRCIDVEAAHLLERDECEMECEDIRDMCGQALATARELGLLEDGK